MAMSNDADETTRLDGDHDVDGASRPVRTDRDGPSTLNPSASLDDVSPGGEDITVPAGPPESASPYAAALSIADTVEVGSTLQGRWSYRLEQRLGRGGFGAVYLASCSAIPGRENGECPPRTAVKVFRPPQGADPVKILKRELSAILALRHDRIPRLYDWRIDEPPAFAAFEYYPEGSLADRLEISGPLGETETWRLLADLLSALAAAHRACLLHLDVKPGNVLLDGCGGFMLADFGISQGSLVSRAIISPGLGSPAFQSPEQRFRDYDSFDARTDLWGAGLTAWMACTGIPVEEFQQILDSVPEQDKYGMPPVRKYRPTCSSRLEDVIMSLLARRPADRPGSAAEVLAGMQALVGEPELETQIDSLRNRATAQDPEVRQLIESLMDPLWTTICRSDYQARYFVRFDNGEYLCREGEQSYYAYVLLRGRVRIERGGNLLTVEDREGAFLGEVTALTGRKRTATMRAEGQVWTCMFNPAELERFVMQNPAVAIRLIKSLAERVTRESAIAEQFRTQT